MRIFKIIGLLLVISLVNLDAFAMKMVSVSGDVAELKITSFSDYIPFGYLNKNGKSDEMLNSVFKKSLDTFFPQNGYKPKYEIFETTENALQNMHRGQTNLFIGAYYSTHIFDDFEFVFPALFNNSVHLMMIPSRIKDVRQVADLKNLKGIYCKKEYFNDHVMQNFKAIGVKEVLSEDEAYEALLTGKADFMLGSYYTNYVALLKKGLKNRVAFSSKPLWNMPMFLALSKMTPNLKIVRQRLQKMLRQEEFKNNILQNMKDFVEDVEKNSAGVVPPTYVNTDSQNVLTPADEQQLERDKN